MASKATSNNNTALVNWKAKKPKKTHLLIVYCTISKHPRTTQCNKKHINIFSAITIREQKKQKQNYTKHSYSDTEPTSTNPVFLLNFQNLARWSKGISISHWWETRAKLVAETEKKKKGRNHGINAFKWQLPYSKNQLN